MIQTRARYRTPLQTCSWRWLTRWVAQQMLENSTFFCLLIHFSNFPFSTGCCRCCCPIIKVAKNLTGHSLPGLWRGCCCCCCCWSPCLVLWRRQFLSERRCRCKEGIGGKCIGRHWHFLRMIYDTAGQWSVQIASVSADRERNGGRRTEWLLLLLWLLPSQQHSGACLIVIVFVCVCVCADNDFQCTHTHTLKLTQWQKSTS